ncbi:helix-turn-helix domain-containing protein [Natronomonas salina]|uniref:helix-turn-helix domain-containing protein n=1 Tax=Natronomonas salina TaxID=1710540 RepID=UPI0015B56DBC|nr:helix-turn-helix domain-containing protein [Natronomonas salina]QLD90256.1 helix-turn-helix domain-containing protein [Natronomonas salina]
MVHRELLAVLLVCCLGVSLVGAQPALAGDGSGTTFHGADSDGLIQENLTDGLIQQDSDDGSDTREGTETETADGETGEDGADSDDGDGESDDNESDDEDGWGGHSDNESDDDGWGDDSDDDHRWGEQRENESDNESSDSDGEVWNSEGRNESDTESDGENSSDNDSDADAGEGWVNGSSDGEENGTDAGNETGNSTTSVNGTLDEFLLDDVTDIVLGVGDVTTNVTADLTGNATNDTGLTRGEMNDWTTDRDVDDDAETRPSSGLERIVDDGLDGTLEAERFDELSAFVDGDGDRSATAGIERLVTSLESESVVVSKVVSIIAGSPVEDDDQQPSTATGNEGAAEKKTGSNEDQTGARDSSIPLAASDDGDDERSDENDTAGADSGDDGGEAPAGGPGEGAALLVLVGYLGGGRVAMNQTAMLASMGQPGLLGTLKHSIASHVGGLSDRILPPVFGYSRHDSSDPLENDTRAQIFELVEESPGIYYAQLAEETDVTVETVRYHCRILADEGLLERRKLRGRQRLYPVSMDDDDPELAAAMADSAASDVLSAIERREPTTLSAVADAVGCAPSTVSYHLDRLEEDGLVSRERDGGSVRIRLRRATKSALQGSVADD